MRKIFLLVILGMFSSTVFGQINGVIRGKVTNTENKPIPGAVVALVGAEKNVVTDAGGNFIFENVGVGQYVVNVTSEKYLPHSQNIEIGSGTGEVRIDFKLENLTETVEVAGRVSEYHTDDTTVATKIPTRLIDTPQSITSISPQVIADRLATDVNDIYKNVAGLNQTTYSAVVFRGFTQRETLFNGVRGNPYGSLEGDVNNAGFSTSILRLSNVERIEVLKGPASVLYGSAEPGGIINFITKKPRTLLDGTAEFRFGQYGLAMGNADFSVPLTKKLYSRFAGFLEQRDSFRNNAGLKNQNYVANLLWQPDDKTRVNFEYEFIRQNQRGHRLRGIPVDAYGRFITDISFTTTERTDFVKLDANVFQANISKDFLTDGRVEATFRYLTNDRFENYHEPRGLLADGRTMRRDFRDQLRKNKDWSFSVNAYKPVNLGNFGVHTLNAGGEYYTQDHQFRLVTVSAGVPSIDIFNPVYGIANPRNYLYDVNQTPTSLAKPSRFGVYLQDHIAFNKYFQFVAGGRWERYKDTGRSGTIPLSAEDSAFTGRIGAVMKPRDNIAFYGNFANSYARPSILAQTTSANGPHKPEKGRQVEGGLKMELLNSRLFVTSSVYQIDKTDVLRPDPSFGPAGNNTNALLSVGAIRNRGFDIDANGAITRRWNVSFNYSHINSRITRDNNPAYVGRRMPNVPANTVGFFTRYDITPEIGVGLGGEFVGEREEPFAGLKAPSYKTFDASYYHTFFQRFRFYAKLENLANEKYALSSLFAPRVGNFPGQPRTFSAGLTILSFRKR
ncbi:MAG: TonB-dependent receptor [Acidobacteriota bacterium]|nr:TonB-dependent receptor [Acidobacteriota bacterium]